MTNPGNIAFYATRNQLNYIFVKNLFNMLHLGNKADFRENLIVEAKKYRNLSIAITTILLVSICFDIYFNGIGYSLLALSPILLLVFSSTVMGWYICYVGRMVDIDKVYRMSETLNNDNES
jgi:hypothetical protein